MRNYKGKNIELLAPAGNFEIFESVVTSKCDAIYLGGQAFNMRMIRKGFNFTDDELIRASDLAHENRKKIYITVNNLIEEDQLDQLKAYLRFLDEKVKPDALIVQDMAVLQLVKEMGLGLELHASVMMNVHNLDMIRLLEKEGVTRVVLSREMSFEAVRRLSENTQVELEYFTHGDMCITHGSQCYYSSLLFGMSSNRGRCLKPCRWWFNTGSDSEQEERAFPLAVKDLSLYRHLPEMLEAGVNTFKIEGRMREKGFITELVNLYGEALDTYIENPVGYDSSTGYAQIENTKKRDLSVGYAFGNPGKQNLNTRHEGTGKFYSTGKMFSTPTPEKEIDESDQLNIENALSKYSHGPVDSQKISVKVQTLSQAETAIALGVDRIYLAGDVYAPNQPFTVSQVQAVKNKMSAHQEIYVTSPRMMDEVQAAQFAEDLKHFQGLVDGILVTQMGVLAQCENAVQKSSGVLEGEEALEVSKTTEATEAYRRWPLAGDYSLNVYNSASQQWYAEHGLDTVTASIEMNAAQLGALTEVSRKDAVQNRAESLAKEPCGLELIVYGRLTSMYFDHDFFKAQGTAGDVCRLSNEAGIYEIYRDQFGKTHLLTTHTLNLLPILKTIRTMNVDMLRIEAQLMSPEELAAVITALKGDMPFTREKQTFGALRF